MPLAYSYRRFSSPSQKWGKSGLRQKRLAEEWLSRNPAYTLDTSLNLLDAGKSGWTGSHLDPKAGLGGFLHLVQQGQIPKGSVLLAESFSRLSRQHFDDAFDLIKGILKAGINISILSPPLDLTKESLRADVGTTIAVIVNFMAANKESEEKSNRLKNTWSLKRDALLENGTKLTGRCPGWLKPESVKVGNRKTTTGFIIIEERARTIQSIFQMAVDGKTVHAICKELNETSVLPITDGYKKTIYDDANDDVREEPATPPKWNRGSLCRLLKDRRVLGEHQPMQSQRDENGKRGKPVPVGEPVLDYYPPICTKEVFREANFRLSLRQPKNLPGKRTTQPFSNKLFDAAGSTLTISHSQTTNKETKHTCFQKRYCSSDWKTRGLKDANRLSVKKEPIDSLICCCISEFVPENKAQTEAHKQIAEIEEREKRFEEKLEATEDPDVFADISKRKAKLKREREVLLKSLEVPEIDPELLSVFSKPRENEVERRELQYVVHSLVSKVVVDTYKGPNKRTAANGTVFLNNTEKRYFSYFQMPKTLGIKNTFTVFRKRGVLLEKVFVLTPDGIASSVCLWGDAENDYPAALNENGEETQVSPVELLIDESSRYRVFLDGAEIENSQLGEAIIKQALQYYADFLNGC